MDRIAYLFVLVLCLAARSINGEDPYLYFTWNVTYGTISPLGVPQQGILVNGQFPGPNLNTTSNNNVIVNVFNGLDQPLLFTWQGIQQRKNSWQDGMPGTNCPIPPGANFTYHFQPKDQIGSFFYFPSIDLQRSSGGFGGLRVNSRQLIPVPFDQPEDDYTVLIGDWFSKGHVALKKILDSGVHSIGVPDGVIINGKSAPQDKPLFTMKPGKTYRYRICNTGVKTSLNFRIQGHDMKLVEIEGSHTVQNIYDSLDIHVGQCYSVLVTANQDPTQDYLMVASTRFIKKLLTATRTISYETPSPKLPPSIKLPHEPPLGLDWSINQFRSFRWNLTASAARPNPQGSYHYGDKAIDKTIRIFNSGGVVNGKHRYAINGISHVDPETPVKLAEYFGVMKGVFEYNVMGDGVDPGNGSITLQPNVFNEKYRDYVEIVFENQEKSIQSWHLDGYSFFAVAIGTGKWAPEKRASYNRLDAVSRNTIQVYPGTWTAILLTLDNAGMWNLRSENLERSYLGEQMYINLKTPENSLRDEYDIPANALLCGAVVGVPKPQPYHQ